MDKSDYIIDKMIPEDWEQVKAIYLQGIATGDATFETMAPEWDMWNSSHLQAGRLVARIGSVVAGWAALSPVSHRPVYSGVAEISLYVEKDHQGLKIGHNLLEALIKESEQNGIWTLQAGIFPENIPSLALHKSCGFREVGRRERIGAVNGGWRDVVLLERRSKLVGAFPVNKSHVTPR